MRLYSLLVLTAVVALTAVPRAALAQAETIPAPAEYFGFEIGADGELARYPDVLNYLQLLGERSGRAAYEPRGTTTDGNPYALLKFSATANLDRLDRLVAINHRLADPRGLSEQEARSLAREGVPFYFLYATIHSTEVGNGLAILNIAHRLATEESPEIREILDNTVVLLVPSQNPDGQVLVVDHWYETQGTGYARVYPDLYHRYTGHDDNRDWFMFTQTETRLATGHSPRAEAAGDPRHAPDGAQRSRIFVPPYRDPHDPNIHPLLLEGQAQIGTAMAGALVSDGKRGVVYGEQYDLWAPARQYMLYHGQPRILTEIASARLADPFVNPAGVDVPLGPQDARVNFPVPYDKGVWRLATSSTTATRGVRRLGTGVQEPHLVDGELLQGASRLGDAGRGAVRLRHQRRPARPVRDLRAAGAATHGRGRYRSGAEPRSPPGAIALSRRLLGRAARPAGRGLREDDARNGRCIRTCGTTPAVRPSRPTT